MYSLKIHITDKEINDRKEVLELEAVIKLRYIEKIALDQTIEEKIKE